MGRSSKGVKHILSVPTFGTQRRTILATHQGMVTVGTPVPEGGWVYAIVMADGRTAVAEATYRDEAVVLASRQVDVDPIRIQGRDGTERAIARMADA